MGMKLVEPYFYDASAFLDAVRQNHQAQKQQDAGSQIDSGDHPSFFDGAVQDDADKQSHREKPADPDGCLLVAAGAKQIDTADGNRSNLQDEIDFIRKQFFHKVPPSLMVVNFCLFSV